MSNRKRFPFPVMATLVLLTGGWMSAHAWQIREASVPFGVVDLFLDDFRGTRASRVEVRAGEEVGMTFRLEGFERLEGLDESGFPEYGVHLEYEIELRDTDGTLVQPMTPGTAETRLGPQDDAWRPLVEWSARIPETGPSGEYEILIRAKDAMGDQQAEKRITLGVRGMRVEPSPTLLIRQVEFARSPEGPWRPLWYFALRDTIFVRYRIVGFQSSPDHEVWVEQDWSVYNEEGETLVSQANAKEEKRQDFYLPRFLSTDFSLRLEDPQPGEYRLQIAIRDREGGQETMAESRFVLRP